jgi:putative intracellular protease/amidase
MKKKIFVFLFDGFSDWEIAYLTPEIRRSERFELVYFSNDGGSVTSMGGLHVNPNTSLEKLKSEDVDMLILPGGTAWEEGRNSEIVDLVNELFNNGRPIASICAATTFVGQLGLLDNLKHTSNDLSYLKAVAPKYTGEGSYQNSLAESDRNIITAKGIAPIEFACEIFRTIGLYDDDRIEKWYQLFKNGIWSE